MSFEDPLGLQRSGYGTPYGRPMSLPSAREIARSDGALPSAPPSMAENEGIGTPRSIMNQFTNEPNPSPRLPGDYVGINFPWSMPNLASVCTRWEPVPISVTDGKICRRSDEGPQLVPLRCVSWKTVEVR